MYRRLNALYALLAFLVMFLVIPALTWGSEVGQGADGAGIFWKILVAWAVLILLCCIVGRHLLNRLSPPEIELDETEHLRRIQKTTKIIE